MCDYIVCKRLILAGGEKKSRILSRPMRMEAQIQKKSAKLHIFFAYGTYGTDRLSRRERIVVLIL